MARYVLPTSASTALTDGASDASSNVQPPTSDNPTPPGRYLGEADSTLSNETARAAVASEGASALVRREGLPKAPTPSDNAPLPTHYRGKSSGEFQRVVAGAAPDTNGLIAEAERWLVNLAPTDRNRRLLEVAILRRDTALLNGLLDVFRRGR